MRGAFQSYTPFWQRVNGILSVMLVLALLCCLILPLCAFLTVQGSEDAYSPPPPLDYDEPRLRIGMVYGSSCKSSYAFTAGGDMTYGYNRSSTDEFEPLGDLPAGDYSVKNLTGYTIELTSFADGCTDFETLMARACLILPRFSLTVFPLLTDNGMTVCLGNFASQSDAQAVADSITLTLMLGGVFPDGSLGQDLPIEAAPDEDLIPSLSVLAYSERNALTLCDAEGSTVYAFDCDTTLSDIRMAVWCDFAAGDRLGVGVNVYESPFEFTRYKTASVDGVSVVTVIEMEKYIMGVLSEELYTSWDLAVQESFAIISRTYAILNHTKHSAYGFNLCSTTNCQVYEGCRKINDNIRTAVENTKGIVLTENGKIASVYYATMGGGSTVNCEESWTSPRTYLKAVPTPWERYRDHGKYTSGTVWHVEMTGEQLYEKLSPYYSDLKSKIVDVHIDQFCTNSSYVYQITFTDSYGNTVTVKKADTIRNRLGLKSGNFVIGKAGQTVKAPVYELDCYPSVYNENRKMQTYYTPSELNFFAVFKNGLQSLTDTIVTAVLSDGETEIDLSKTETEIVTGEDSFRVNEDGRPDILNGTIQMYYEDVKLESTTGRTDVFIIEGKGYGHGIGICQYGAWDLARAGYDYLTILRYYFKNVTFGYVTDFLKTP